MGCVVFAHLRAAAFRVLHQDSHAVLPVASPTPMCKAEEMSVQPATATGAHPSSLTTLPRSVKDITELLHLPTCAQ